MKAPAFPRLVCPGCRGSLRLAAGYTCVKCGAEYPIIAGIPDFRVAPDPWISLEDDRAKALRLEAMTAGCTFEETVRAYWAMTPGTPVQRAERFTRHVLAAASRSRDWLARESSAGGSPSPASSLDLGCGTGDLAVALADSGGKVVGIDIALRWLIVARKRPGVAGRVSLFCCCAERLPFEDDAFDEVCALGLLEHTPDAAAVAVEARRVVRPGGTIRLRTVNRYSLLPEPHVGVWGVGYVPRKWADALVRRRSGQRYLHHRPLSARELQGSLARAGFTGVSVRAGYFLERDRERLSRWLRPLVGGYGRMRNAPLIGRALRWIAPELEAVARRPAAGTTRAKEAWNRPGEAPATLGTR